MAWAPPTVKRSHQTERADPMYIDTYLLEEVAKVAADAGERLLAVYSPDARPASREELTKAAIRNEEVSSAGLREALHALRPGARWLEEENETGALPDGEWWVVDNAEGSVNHVHGLPEWGVSICLVVDGVPELGVFASPSQTSLTLPCAGTVPTKTMPTKTVPTKTADAGSPCRGSPASKWPLSAPVRPKPVRPRPTPASAARSRPCSRRHSSSVPPCPRPSRCC